ncbi:hypothetical protein [Clostridium tetani]|uniref:hypothetical protein n=1 Tax=Clostridium tetani TaxID=1513 RepID=UPI0013E96978|nr:hypothetical protein [Clostridium tetani]
MPQIILILAIGLISCISIVVVNLRYSFKKVQTIKDKSLNRPDYIRMEGKNVKQKKI